MRYLLHRHTLRLLPAAILCCVLAASLLAMLACGTHRADARSGARSASDSMPLLDSAITIAAVGDIMMGSTFPTMMLPPEDGRLMLLPIAGVLQGADLAFGNLEGPLLDGGSTKKCQKDTANCYAFRVPTRYGAYLQAAGFDLLSIANNHALDFGEQGRASTIRVLDSLGIAWSGPPGTFAEREVRGRRVAFVAFSFDDDSNNLRDTQRSKELVRTLAKTHDIVIVSFHGGAEGAKHQHVPKGEETAFGEQRGDLRTFTHAMIDAGADLLLGHGPHVVRGLEVYKDRLIAYSLGNFATYAMFNLNGPNGLACILQLRLAEDGRFLSGFLMPTKQIKPGGPLADPEAAIVPIVQDLSMEDFGSGSPVIGGDGRFTPRR